MLTEDTSEYNYIYVAFLMTNTNIGRIIRFFTHNQFSHVTLAFDRELSKMYSFSRYHVNSPFYGGFVEERPNRYLSDDMDVTVKICKLSVSDEEYQRICEEISYFNANKRQMLYNTPNAILSIAKKRLKMKNTYTCLEFVSHLLRFTNVIAIKDLEHQLNKYIVYKGSFKDIAKWEQSYTNEDDYFMRRHVIRVVLDTIYHFQKIVVRLIHT